MQSTSDICAVVFFEKGIFGEDGGFSSYVVIAPNKYVQPLVKLGLLSECGSLDKGTFCHRQRRGVIRLCLLVNLVSFQGKSPGLSIDFL